MIFNMMYLSLLLLLIYAFHSNAISHRILPSTKNPPVARKAMAMGFDSVQLRIMIYSGSDSTTSYYKDLWVFDLKRMEWEELTWSSDPAPTERLHSHIFIDDTGSGAFLLAGRNEKGPILDMWYYHFLEKRWNSLSVVGAQPISSIRTALTDFKIGDETFVAAFGGYKMDGNSNTLQIMKNVTIYEYSGLNNMPSPRSSASISYYNHALYIFGGAEEIDNIEFTTDNQLYRFDMYTQEWSIIEILGDKPPGMHLHCTIVYDGYLYVVYGFSIEGSMNIPDIWRINLDNPTSWEKMPLANSKEEMHEISRSMHRVVEYDGVMYMFGGWTIYGSRNDLLSLDLKKQPYEWKELSKNGIYPPSRRGHTSFQLDNHIYIFGGENEEYHKFNDAWRYNIEKEAWHSLVFQTLPPSPRSDFASTKLSDVVAIFGGTSEEDYLNDLYLVNFYSMTTIEVQPVSDIIPSPRIGACMTSMNNYLFLFGGLTSQGLNSELWAYNISQNKYELFPSLYVQPPASAYSSCHAEYEEGSIVIYVYFGRTYGDTPLSCIYKYNLGTKTWVEVRKNTYEVTLSRTRSIIIKFNEKLLIIAGEQWSTRVLNDIVEMNYKTGEYKKVGNLPFGIYNSAGVYFKDKVYIFGGGSSFGLTLLINSTRNLFLEISMNKECGDNCNWPCSLGSYRTEFGCQTCPQGYYSNSLGDDFLPCPEGTYGNTKGADSIRQCYPCPEKTFNDIQGSPFCKICSETYVCLAGSITHSIKRFSSNGLTSSQPKAYKRLEGIDDQVAGIQYGGGFICLFILILFLLVTRLRNKLDRLDMFDESHNYDPEQCMRLRSTKIGGAFTIIYIFIILTYVAASALIFALDNIEEIKNLVPSIIYEDENFIIEAKEVYISFMFENYGGDCDETVDDKLNIYTNDMFAKLLRKKVTKNEGNCYVDLYYENWSVGFEAELELYIQEENSYASAIFTNITASSSIPDEYSSVTTYIRPPENTIFKGYNPTQINIQATPSIFKSDSTKWPSEEMGYHIAINENSDIGSYIQMLDYPFTSEIKVKLNFKRDTSVLVTTRKFKQDALIFLGSLLGALSGFLELVEFAMGKVEANYTELALKYKKHVKLRGIHDHAVLLKNSLASKIRGSLDSRSPTTSIKLLRKSKFFQISELHKLKLDKHKLQSEEIERQLI